MNIKVKGGQVISGELTPSGSKNSAVALIPASVMFKEKVVLTNIPEITDVTRLVAILEKLGSVVVWDKKESVLTIDNRNISFTGLDKEDLGNMKGVSLLWGPMLARFGEVSFKDLPGGCTLGFRTLDPHYQAFKELGVEVRESAESVSMNAKNAKATEVWLREMSPTATENVVTLATRISGTTRIVGAASEPQVQDLCNFLVESGASIHGIGSSVLEITGGKPLTPPASHELLSDHYEITTFLALGALTGGEVRIKKAIPQHMRGIVSVFNKFNVSVEYEGDAAIVHGGQQIKIMEKEGRGTLAIKAQPWPALPVDTLPLFIALSLKAESGQALFHNWMYDAGLFWTSELQKYGVNVVMCDPHRVIINAGNQLRGATIEAPYIIRAVVALVMAGMIAEGESTILNADALYRGHPHFAENLKRLGAEIEEIK